MHIIGFNYTKITAELPEKQPKVERVTQNVEFTDVQQSSIQMVKDSHVLRIQFTFHTNYEPNGAKIELKGTILLATTEELVKEAQKLWKKKELPGDLRLALMNFILNKCGLKALNLEEELNLKPHMRLVKIEQKN